MDNITLIGMPGAGKSTIGVILAKTLGYIFIDTDLLIQLEKNMLLHQIIKKFGISDFLNIEGQVLANLKAERSIIATGGSAVYSEVGMESLKRSGKVVYLNVNFEEINRRLKNIKTRGVVIEEGRSLKDLYFERKELYEKYADIIIDCNGKNAEEIVEEIVDKI